MYNLIVNFLTPLHNSPHVQKTNYCMRMGFSQ